jgi:hypothetical protein
MKRKQAMSVIGMLLALTILGVLFFLMPKFMPSKEKAEDEKTPLFKKTEKQEKQNPYVTAYEIGTSKAKEVQAVADERNSSY